MSGVGERRRWWQWLGLALLLLTGLHAVRSAVVAAEGTRRPALAAAIWPTHPVPLFSAALAGIGAAAAQGRDPAPALLQQVEQGARSAPLAVEPLLVAATSRLAAGDNAAAERMLLAAVRRQPRAPAPRFLLTDLYVRQNRLPEAMRELAALDRRIGNVSAVFAPAVASYLRQPGAVSTMRPVLADNPPLRQAVVGQLSLDPQASRLLLGLVQAGDTQQNWFPGAIDRLLASGDVATIQALLQRTGGLAEARKLSGWRPGPLASPFGWRFPAAGSAVVEPVANGPLRVVYYGRDEAVLAQHSLLLPAGPYRLVQSLAMTGGGPAGDDFQLRVNCGGPAAEVLLLSSIPKGSGAATFAIPASCPAQRLQLLGRPGDFPRTVTAELTGVSLNRLEAGGTR